MVVPVDVGGELTDLSFRPIAGNDWANLTASCPPRPGAKSDDVTGYNTDAVARRYPLDHVLVDGGPILDDEGKPDVVTWNDMFDVMPSPSIKLVAAALWGLNQNDPQKRIADLGKARLAASTKKRPSRASSGSRRAGSQAGNPPK